MQLTIGSELAILPLTAELLVDCNKVPVSP